MSASNRTAMNCDLHWLCRSNVVRDETAYPRGGGGGHISLVRNVTKDVNTSHSITRRFHAEHAERRLSAAIFIKLREILGVFLKVLRITIIIRKSFIFCCRRPISLLEFFDCYTFVCLINLLLQPYGQLISQLRLAVKCPHHINL